MGEGHYGSDRKGHTMDERGRSRGGDFFRSDRGRPDGRERTRRAQRYDRRDGPGDRDMSAYPSRRREDRYGPLPKKARVGDAAAAEAAGPSAPRGRVPLASVVPQPAQNRPTPMTAAERAAAELEAFARRSHADVDPNAPAAVKSSPSVSGDEQGAPEVHGGMPEPRPPAMLSRCRWSIAELEENGDAGEVGKVTAEAEAAAMAAVLGTAGSDEASGAGLGTDTVLGPRERHIDMLKRCRRVDNFENLGRISAGTFGVVYKARDMNTDCIFALKKVRMENEDEEAGFPLPFIREINILLSIYHVNIVDVSEVVVGGSLDDIYLVMEYMDCDLKGLQESMTRPFAIDEVKCMMKQLFEGINYLHENWVLHRDLKTSNILYNNGGQLKICDFGLARQFASPLRAYTQTVVTLWYRAPELLLGTREYSTPIDMWSLGCIMAELLTGKVLFDGEREPEQMEKIWKVLGTPSEANWPAGHRQLRSMGEAEFPAQPRNKLHERLPLQGPLHDSRDTLSFEGYKLLNGLLQLDPSRRLTAKEALKHAWFEEHPLPKEQAKMPRFEERDVAAH